MSSKITINDNGPIKVEGVFEICDGTGTAFGVGERKAVFLCRCGHSQNKPFCDGSHKRNAFDSKVTARTI